VRQVDLISFLCNYYGIVSDSLKNNKLSHIDVKILFPNIIHIGFKELKRNYHKIHNDDVILVRDYKGEVLPYINPRLDIDKFISIVPMKIDNEKIDISDIELDKLSKDELLKLRKKLKKNQKNRDENVIVREIRRKKNHQIIKYKTKKCMLRMEEF